MEVSHFGTKLFICLFSLLSKMALTISPFGPAGPETPAGPIRPFKHEQKMTHVRFNGGDG